MRAKALAAAAALALGGCSLTIDPDSVPPPATVNPTCVSTGCAAVVCGNPDNCGTTCTTGCIANGHAIQGDLTYGAANMTGSHQITGSFAVSGAAASSASHRIDQGTLR